MVNQCLQILHREDQALGGNAEGRARLCVHSDFSRQSAAFQAAFFFRAAVSRVELFVAQTCSSMFDLFSLL